MARDPAQHAVDPNTLYLDSEICPNLDPDPGPNLNLDLGPNLDPNTNLFTQ